MQNVLVDMETYVLRCHRLGISRSQAIERYKRIRGELGVNDKRQQQTYRRSSTEKKGQ